MQTLPMRPEMRSRVFLVHRVYSPRHTGVPMPVQKKTQTIVKLTGLQVKIARSMMSKNILIIQKDISAIFAAA